MDIAVLAFSSLLSCVQDALAPCTGSVPLGLVKTPVPFQTLTLSGELF
jgi:hypothetical protein